MEPVNPHHQAITATQVIPSGTVSDNELTTEELEILKIIRKAPCEEEVFVEQCGDEVHAWSLVKGKAQAEKLSIRKLHELMQEMGLEAVKSVFGLTWLKRIPGVSTIARKISGDNKRRMVDKRRFRSGDKPKASQYTMVKMIQIMRRCRRIGALKMRELLEAIRVDDPEIVVCSTSTIHRAIHYFREHKIPERLNASESPNFYKQFGIRIPYPWEHTNQCHQVDEAYGRFLVRYGKKGFLRPHVLAVRDASSGFVLAVRMLPYNASAVDVISLLGEAMLPKADPIMSGIGGIPDILRFDQHGQFRNQDVAAFAVRVGSKPDPVPKGQSPHNGSIERIFGIYRTQFESNFPDFLKGRGMYISDGAMDYSPSYHMVEVALQEWVKEYNFEFRSRLDGLTAFERYLAGLPKGKHTMPPNFENQVDAAMVVQEAVQIDSHGIIRSKTTGQDYTGPDIAGYYPNRATLIVSIARKNAAAQVVIRGTVVGNVRPIGAWGHRDAELNEAVKQATLGEWGKTREVSQKMKKVAGAPAGQLPLVKKRQSDPNDTPDDWMDAFSAPIPA